MNLGKPDCADCKWSGLPCGKHCVVKVSLPCGHRSVTVEGLTEACAARLGLGYPCPQCREVR